MTLTRGPSADTLPEGGNPPAFSREQAPAKVNLTLHVLGKRSDGYHELESLVAFASLCDELIFYPGSEEGLVLDGPFAGAVDGENLVFIAKRAVAAWLGREITGRFRLEKHIPVAAGLGGGSSDAAAAIRLLLREYDGSSKPETFMERAAAIGADVPVCLYRKPAWMCGLGERVTPAARFGVLPAVLVNPRVRLSTPEVFKQLQAPPFKPVAVTKIALADADFSSPEAAAASLMDGCNDLERPAISLEPAVAAVLGALRGQDNCLLARLSGSGPTCFGLFPTPESAGEAASAMAEANPAWWIVPTLLS